MEFKLEFGFHEGFTERLMSARFDVLDEHIINYSISSFPIGEQSGQLDLKPEVLELIKELLIFIEEVSSNYESGWDDMRSSYFKITFDNQVKEIKIDEVIDRSSLSKKAEIILFKLNDVFIKMADETYKSNKLDA